MEPEIEVTPEMIEAGAEVILCEFGGCDVFFSAPDLAKQVFLAMVGSGLPARPADRPRNP
jgi:hypothetical protein